MPKPRIARSCEDLSLRFTGLMRCAALTIGSRFRTAADPLRLRASFQLSLAETKGRSKYNLRPTGNGSAMKTSRWSVGAGGLGGWTSIVPDIRAGSVKAFVSPPSRFGRWHRILPIDDTVSGFAALAFFRRCDAHRHARGDLRQHRGPRQNRLQGPGANPANDPTWPKSLVSQPRSSANSPPPSEKNGEN